MVLLSAVFFIAILRGREDDVGLFWWYMAFCLYALVFVFVVGWMMLSRILKPVAISVGRDGSVKISVKNKDVFEEFVRLNRAILEATM